MAKQYSAEFKLEAVRRVERTGEAVSKVAADLGVNENTMYGWVKRYRNKSVVPFPGSGRLSPEDERVRKLERENRDLREENEILNYHLLKQVGYKINFVRVNSLLGLNAHYKNSC